MNNLVSFTPLMRQTVGFDRFNDLFESLLSDSAEERFEAYPPYNIEKIGEDDYRIVIAIAGFTESDLDITVENDRLTVSGRHGDHAQDEGENYLHRGIATRAFQRTFRLADHIQIEDAQLKDGLLTIELKREIPEEKKPRMIPINGKSKNRIGTRKKKG